MRTYFFGSKSADPWFEKYMLTFNSAKSLPFAVDIDNYVEGAASDRLEVSMSGVTEWPQKSRIIM